MKVDIRLGPRFINNVIYVPNDQTLNICVISALN